MPRPRFEKLSAEKRERILEAAAREFARRGFDGASLNHILEQAEISKGAAYYYFDDKADLYATVVQHYSDYLLGDMEFVIDQLNGENFWSQVAALYQHQFAASYEKPWVFGAVKSAARLSPEVLANTSLAPYLAQIQHGLAVLVKKGQEVGAVRADLPNDLLLALFTAVDDASDQWLLAHWHELDQAQMEAIVTQVLDAVRRLLAPAKRQPHDD